MYDMTHHAVQEMLVINFKNFYLYECTVKKFNPKKIPSLKVFIFSKRNFLHLFQCTKI